MGIQGGFPEEVASSQSPWGGKEIKHMWAWEKADITGPRWDFWDNCHASYLPVLGRPHQQIGGPMGGVLGRGRQESSLIASRL